MIEVNCQSSIKLIGSKILYFDPINQKNNKDADYIFITHPHWDHFSKEDILKIKTQNTQIIGPKEIMKATLEMGFQKENIIVLEPNMQITIDDIKIKTVPSYNINKSFHPKENKWLGYIVDLDNITYYIPGDTDIITEMEEIQVDICFIPIGGTYTMNAKEAAQIINKIKPKKVIPIHYGMVVGNKQDYEIFQNNVPNNIKIEELIKC